MVDRRITKVVLDIFDLNQFVRRLCPLFKMGMDSAKFWGVILDL